MILYPHKHQLGWSMASTWFPVRSSFFGCLSTASSQRLNFGSRVVRSEPAPSGSDDSHVNKNVLLWIRVLRLPKRGPVPGARLLQEKHREHDMEVYANLHSKWLGFHNRRKKFRDAAPPLHHVENQAVSLWPFRRHFRELQLVERCP